MKFHKCVDLHEFQHNNKILFVPPDGKFELMNYSIKSQVSPLFNITVDTIKFNHSVGEFVFTLGTRYKKKSIAKDVKILIPVPADSMDF